MVVDVKKGNGRALKSGIWYTASNFLVKSIGFITTPIFTRLLTHSEFGAFNNYTSWLNIITIFVTLNLESTLISARFDFEKKFDEYILSVLSLSTTCALLWLVVFNVFSTTFEQFLDLDSVYINVMLIYLIFMPAINIYQARERYLFEYKKTVLISLIIAVCTAILSVLLVMFMENGLMGRVIGSALPSVIVGIILYILIIKKGKKIELKYWKYAIQICFPYIPHLLSMTLLNSTDRIMITKFCGAEDTALYSLAYSCGAIVTILITSLNSAFAPWLGEKLHEDRIQEIRYFSKKYISAFLIFAIGIMLVSPEVLLILGGRTYYEAIYVLAPVSMGCVCQFLYTLFVNVEQFKKKTVGMAIASALAALINLELNYLFIPKVGYLVAAYTTLVGYICLLMMHMYLVKRVKLSEVYDYKFVILTVIVGTVLMALVTILYSHRIIRYIAVFIYCVALLVIIRKYKNVLLEFTKIRKA